MQDFARFCNAKIDFRRERALTRSQLLELKSRVVQLIKHGGDKATRCGWSLQFHCNTAIDKSQLGAKLEA
jgi:hypothetical protein